MSNERDELADILMSDDVMFADFCGRDYALHEADAILAAGYRKPRTVTTVAELDALPVGTVVLSGFAVSKRVDLFWWKAGWSEDFASTEVALPATVLYEGSAS